MEIRLPAKLQSFVEAKVSSGEYPDANAVVENALESLLEQEILDPAYEEYARGEVQRAMEQANRGAYAQFDAESIIAQQRKGQNSGRETR